MSSAKELEVTSTTLTRNSASLADRLLGALRLYARYTAVSIRGQMQYKTSFWLMSVGQLMASGSAFVGMWVLFSRFGSVRGWTLAEVAFFYGMINVAFALADAFGRGFDLFPKMVKSGDFDRILLRPRSLALQIGARELLLTRVGRLSQGALVLAWSLNHLPVHWSAAKAFYLVTSILGGAALFNGLFVLQATFSFWTIESLELMNILTYGGTEIGQYPLSIYRSGFRAFFTVIVPIACINFFPIQGLLRSTLAAPAVFAPAAGFLFLTLSLQVWRLGIRHYTSTGS